MTATQRSRSDRQREQRPRHAIVLAVAALTALALALGACSDDGGNQNQNRTGSGTTIAGDGTTSTASPSTATTPSAPSTTATATLASILVRAVTEERHAEATYDNIVKALGDIAPFTNIAASEATHVATLEALAKAHGVDVSGATATGDAAPPTKTAACQLGVNAELADIALYDELLPQVSAYPDVVQVLTNLRAASRDSHLPAFRQCR